MILAEKITKLRKQQGWSQEELAARLDVSRPSGLQVGIHGVHAGPG